MSDCKISLEVYISDLGMILNIVNMLFSLRMIIFLKKSMFMINQPSFNVTDQLHNLNTGSAPRIQKIIKTQHVLRFPSVR